MKEILIKIFTYDLLFRLKTYYNFLISIFYLGQKYHCPNCNTNFKKLLPCGLNQKVLNELEVIGSGLRDNCLCPRCNSIDRERLIYLYLKYKTHVFSENITMLHVAPRYSLKKIFKKHKNINYIAGDKFEKGYNYTKDVIHIDLTSLNFDDEYFDVIICNHVLEHIPDDIKALKEIYRVLKKDGFAILQVPLSLKLDKTLEGVANNEEERLKYYGQKDHYRIYAKDYFINLENCNFVVNAINPNDAELNFDTQKYALNPKEDLIIVYKS